MTNAIKSDRQIVVRFPPSPTGEIHIGNVRTLLFNFLFARQNNGKIVFRFEDTDKERSKREYEQPMLEALANLGLSFDDGPYRQSDRLEIYNSYLKKLVDEGLAYEDVENANKTGKIIRLKNIERDIVWKDLVKGEIKINTHTFKERDSDGNFTGENSADIIIARSINDPIYHFTVVVDDWLMGVTHVIRGDDHITSTPRQIMILEALGAPIPEYAHLPTIIGEDKKKLSKRNGNTSLNSFLQMGYLKETMVNYLALLGWNPGTEKEFFTLDELIKEFSIEKCQVSPAQFDFKKLDNINKFYLQKLPDEIIISNLQKVFSSSLNTILKFDEKTFEKIILLVVKPRINKYNDFYELIDNGDLNMFDPNIYQKELNVFDKNKFCFKNKDGVQSLEEAKENMQLVKAKLENISEENWNIEFLKNEIWDWSATIGRGQILHPLRMLLSLKEKSPDPFTIMEIIGKKESLSRLDNSI